MGKLLTTEEFIEKARNIHGNKYDYSLTNYIFNTQEINIICPKHGIFKQIPNSHLQGAGCPKCRQYRGETKISKILIKKKY